MSQVTQRERADPPGVLAAVRTRAHLAPVARYLPVALTAVLLLFGAGLLVARLQLFGRLGLIGIDLEIYLGYAQRFVETGSMYAPGQIVGPYDGQPYVSGPIPADMPCLYPPSTIYLFAPFVILPRLLWWLIPLGLFAFVLWRLRPQRWSWPLLVLPLVTPDFTAGLVSGNTGMWLLAAVAGGILFGWPALLVLVKPFLAPFALIGIRRRAWWIGLGISAALSLPLASQWLDYPKIIANARDVHYDPVGYVPMLLVPAIAWIARQRPSIVHSPLAEVA